MSRASVNQEIIDHWSQAIEEKLLKRFFRPPARFPLNIPLDHRSGTVDQYEKSRERCLQ